MAVGLTVVGPSVLCISLLLTYRGQGLDRKDEGVALAQDVPLIVEEQPTDSAPIASPPPGDANAEPAATPVESLVPPRGDGDPFVSAMTPWGVVLSNDPDSSWARGKIVELGYGTDARSADVASKEVEMAHLPLALRQRVGQEVIGYGREGEVCRGVIGTPRLVKVFNGWQDMLGEQEPLLYSDDDGELPKVSSRVVRKAVWGHVEEAWLVAPVLTDGSCNGAVIAASTSRVASPLLRQDEPPRDGVIAERLSIFLKSRGVRAMKRDYEGYRSEAVANATPDEEGQASALPPTWNQFVKKNLRLRAFQAATGELVALSFSLEDNEAEGCGVGFWGSTSLLERQQEPGEWVALGQAFPDAAVLWAGGWMDATVDFELGLGTSAKLRHNGDLPEFHRLMSRPITEENLDPAAGWEMARGEVHSAIAYFEGCPC